MYTVKHIQEKDSKRVKETIRKFLFVCMYSKYTSDCPLLIYLDCRVWKFRYLVDQAVFTCRYRC